MGTSRLSHAVMLTLTPSRRSSTSKTTTDRTRSTPRLDLSSTDLVKRHPAFLSRAMWLSLWKPYLNVFTFLIHPRLRERILVVRLSLIPSTGRMRRTRSFRTCVLPLPSSVFILPTTPFRATLLCRALCLMWTNRCIIRPKKVLRKAEWKRRRPLMLLPQFT